jgi:enterochelin esterase-like enzyme
MPTLESLRFLTFLALLIFPVWAFPQPPSEPPGKVEFLTLPSKLFHNTRTIRVWLPPEYFDEKQKDRRYPVFYFTDGIAVFDGRELARIALELTRAGKIPPMIFVGIDNGGSTRESKNPGSDRANEYLPFPDEFLQPPVARPHGELFPAFLENEVRPLVDKDYRTTQDAGLAGSSYGGAIAVYTAMENPGRYRWLLVESPSLYIANDELLHRAEKFRDWPGRVYVGAGTEEGTGDAKLEMVRDATRFAGLIGGKTSKCLVIVPGADHSENAWRARLPGALHFLLGNAGCPSDK